MTTYTEIPSVLIQDSSAGHAYVISSSELTSYKLTADKLFQLHSGVVTFVIPDDDLIETTPPFNATESAQPNIVIQHLSKNESYFLTYEQLQLFRVDQPNDYGGYGISFVIPAGNEFIEDLSAIQRAILQSGEMAAWRPLETLGTTLPNQDISASNKI